MLIIHNKLQKKITASSEEFQEQVYHEGQGDSLVGTFSVINTLKHSTHNADMYHMGVHLYRYTQ